MTSHHSLGYEPAVYGLQVRVPTFTSHLDGGQKSPRKKSHSKTHDKVAIVYISWRQKSPCSELIVWHVRRCDLVSAPCPPACTPYLPGKQKFSKQESQHNHTYSCQPFPYTRKEDLREVTEATQSCFSQLRLLGLAKRPLIKEPDLLSHFYFFLIYFCFVLFFLPSQLPVCSFSKLLI